MALMGGKQDTRGCPPPPPLPWDRQNYGEFSPLVGGLNTWINITLFQQIYPFKHIIYAYVEAKKTKIQRFPFNFVSCFVEKVTN